MVSLTRFWRVLGLVRRARSCAILRAIVASGWFGIQAWLGGWASHLYDFERRDRQRLKGSLLPLLGISFVQLIRFLLFWALHIYFITKGTDSIRWMETAAAPLLLLSGVALVRWAYSKAGGFGPMLALNILDFTRFARSQRDQIIGQAIGLPIPMGWLLLVAVLVTSAMVVIYGEAIWDPAALTGEMGGAASWSSSL